MAEVPMPAVGPEASAASVHGWLTVVSTAASSCLGEGEMLESRILCKTGAQHGVQNGGVTLKKICVKTFECSSAVLWECCVPRGVLQHRSICSYESAVTAKLHIR